MHRLFPVLAVLSLCLYGYPRGAAGENPSAVQFVERLDPGVTLTPLHGGRLAFEQPVWCSPLPAVPGTLIVLEHQTGKAWTVSASGEKSLFADWGEEVSDGPWEGLMCIAFHPDFAENRRFFLKHETLIEGRRHTVVVEKRATPDYLRDSGAPSRRLLAVEQPADNHNGGTAAFGPDGYLYIGMGDGGPQEDPEGFTQSGRSLLGKMLRIDVADGDLPYGIPADNPFVEADPRFWRPEIWALGLREPWRFTFDRETGELWLGDVGQVRFEEVVRVKRGENHGWNVLEGWESFSEKERRAGEVYTPPLLAYGRGLGASVTGGYVYRGSRFPGWRGVYVFADFTTRRLFGLRADAHRVTALLEIGEVPEAPASFGEMEDGELLVVGYGGTLYRLEFPETAFPEALPPASEAWAERRREVQETAARVMGAFPGEERRVSLDLEVLQEVDLGSYFRRLITYQSEPGSRTPAYLCVPKAVASGEATAPAVLCLHPTDNAVGHQVVVGLGGREGRQYAAELAERGYVTLAPAYPLLANYWPNLSALGYESGTMKAIWDNSRALDLLESMPGVRAEDGFGAIGHSLGGHNALFTALFDDRIQVVVSSCGFDAFADYYDGDPDNWLYGRGWCQLRYMPRLSHYRNRLQEIPFDFPDIIGALAPRRLFVSAPQGDDNFRWRSVAGVMEEAAGIYRRFQAGDRLQTVHPESGHDFPPEVREKAYAEIAGVLGKP